MFTGCAYFYTPTAGDLHTNYQADKIYILQKDVTMQSIAFKWFPTINNPEYMLNEKFHIKDIPVIPKGSKIQFKKVLHEYNIEIGHMYDPVGILQDSPHEGEPVVLTFISQRKEVTENKFGTYGKYINTDFLIPYEDK